MTKSSLEALSSSSLSETVSSSQQPPKIEQIADDIKNLVRQTAQNIIEIGSKLREVKQMLGHGAFTKWLKTEFNWSLSTAAKMMQASQRFKEVNFAHLNVSPSAIYLLAAPSTPDTARAEAISRASQGESISYSLAKKLVEHSKKIQEITLESQSESKELIEGEESQNNGLEPERAIFDDFIRGKVPWDSQKSPESSEPFSEISITSQVEPQFFQHYLTREWFRSMRQQESLSIVVCLIDDPLFQTDKKLSLKAEMSKKRLCQIFHQVLKRPTDLFTDNGPYFLLLFSLTEREGAETVIKIIEKKARTLLGTVDSPKSPLSPSPLCLRYFIYSLIPTQPLSWEELFPNILQHEFNIATKGQ